MMPPEPPLALLAELTHRCPLQCPYCSNPLDLVPGGRELSTAQWRSVFEQAAAMGVLQVHLSGGEPAARRDLEEIVASASGCGLYANLITSGLGLDRDRLGRLEQAGLAHLQLSFQDTDAAAAERFAGGRDALARKRALAREVGDLGLALTVNAVLHRGNLARLQSFLELALEFGAQRIELAHVQYHGWALANRSALLPDRQQLALADATVAEARAQLQGRLAIDYVPPDYYARRPKACMAGWGRRFLLVAPDGLVLPCHAARDLPGMVFENAAERPLAAIWERGEAFVRFRGTDWMPEPCSSCDRREIDWGGCRCQAFALTGDAAATDPVCTLSPDHERVGQALAEAAAESGSEPIRRRYGGVERARAALAGR